MWAVVFPGQGSQSIGMGRFLFEHFASAKRIFEEASDTLKINMAKLCFEGPDTDLALTENTQPCLLLVSTAYFKVLTEIIEFQISYGAGHSLGEYSALVSAGAMKFSDTLLTVRARGKAMQEASPVNEGAMAAVMGLDESEVEQLCQWATQNAGTLRPANFNAPGQIVISGKASAMEWVKQNLANMPIKKRMKLISLNVSAPFHSPLMRPAEEKMRPVLQALKFEKPSFPIVQNTTARETQDPTVLLNELAKQISAPVRWEQSVTRLGELGVTRILECGPGKVLTSLIKKIDSERFQTFNVNSLEELKDFERRVLS